MCENKVRFYTPKGRELLLQCGRTGMHGERVICEKCRNNADTMRDIRDHEENMAADNAWLRSAGWGEM